MDETKKVEKPEAEKEDTMIENEHIFKLLKEVKFEEKTYSEIDLKGLQDLTTKDLIQARKMYSYGRVNELNPELTQEFACSIAAIKTGLPYEFFMALSAKDGMRLKRRVQDFLY